MQLLKSLFCLRGFDNRSRFIIITFFCLLSFIILNEIFISSLLAAFICLLFCLSVSIMATQRRLNDAKLHRNWLLAPASTFLISGLITIFTGHGSVYWLLLVPLLLSLLLLTYPSAKTRSYILGYLGPVDLSAHLQKTRNNLRSHQRIEPKINTTHYAESITQPNQASLAVNATHNSSMQSTDKPNTSFNTPYESTNDVGESIRLYIFSKNNTRTTLSIIAFILILAVTILLIFGNGSSEMKIEGTLIKKVIEKDNELKHHITLPDNFSLMISRYNGLVISWQSNSEENTELWSIKYAQGDKSCQNIQFNKGDTIRSYKVAIENDGQHFAYFSPLDTTALVKNIAFKGRFSLCGYEFSLKGSQTILGKAEFYANLIEY